MANTTTAIGFSQGGGYTCYIARRVQYLRNIYYLPYHGTLTVEETRGGWKLRHPAFRGGVVSVGLFTINGSLWYYAGGYKVLKDNWKETRTGQGLS